MTFGRTRRAARGALRFVAASVIALTVSAARADDPPRPWLAQAPSPAPAAVPAAEPTRIPWRASLLIGVSAAIGGAAVWVRSRKGGLAKLTSSRELRVISSVRVGPKGHLVLAGIGDRALLLGVTDNSVRRIAWLPADQIAGSLNAADALRTVDGASTAMAAGNAPGGGVTASGPAPAGHPSTRASSRKGAFADILHRLGGRHVDAPPADAEGSSAASTLAELRRDTVQWSNTAVGAAGSTLSANKTDDGGELEQQAAGILKRRSRRRT